MGIDNEFDSIVAKFTEKISNVGEVDVDAALQFKNPPSLHQKILEIPERQYKYLKVSVMYHMRCEFAASL